MPENKSQCQAILDYLKSGRSITHIEALQLFGCARLAARINDLRLRGCRIVTDMVINGQTRYAAYRLES